MKTIVGITAFFSGGKGIVSPYFQQEGYQVYEMSDALREELKERSKRGTLTELATEWRKEHGFGAMAIESWKRVQADPEKFGDKIVISGIRSPEEIEFFQELAAENGYQYYTVGIKVDKEPLMKRYLNREDRSEDDRTIEGFEKQWNTENFAPEFQFRGQNVPACLAMADWIIDNNKDFVDGKLPDETVEQIKEIISQIEGMRRNAEGQAVDAEGRPIAVGKEAKN